MATTTEDNRLSDDKLVALSALIEESAGDGMTFATSARLASQTESPG